MYTGILQRRWSAERPQEYDKETRIVCMDIKAEKGNDGKSEHPVDGYSFLQVELDHVFDYGHVKSQLIEAGFGQKDEFGLLMNAVNGILTAAQESTFAKFKEALDVDDVQKFADFCAFRAMCAEAAKVVMSNY